MEENEVSKKGTPIYMLVALVMSIVVGFVICILIMSSINKQLDADNIVIDTYEYKDSNQYRVFVNRVLGEIADVLKSNSNEELIEAKIKLSKTLEKEQYADMIAGMRHKLRINETYATRRMFSSTIMNSDETDRIILIISSTEIAYNISIDFSANEYNGMLIFNITRVTVTEQ